MALDVVEVEVVAEFAGRIPLLVMAHLLGFPPEGADDYRRYVQAVLDRHQGDATQAARASGIARRYFQLLRARQAAKSG